MNEQNGAQGEAQRFAEAVAIANIPVLLMVLVQLTGELRWLEERYRTRRARGMNDNDTGGLPEPLRAEVRTSALEAILAWRAGRPVAIPEPSAELRLKMLSSAMGEEIPAEYDSIIAAELSLGPDEATEKLPVPDGFEVLIIGAGVSGLCAAINLQRAGIPFTILEKSDDGGRDLAGQPLSRRRCRYPKPSLLVRERSLRLVDVLCAARRTPRLPRACRRQVRPAFTHPLRD